MNTPFQNTNIHYSVSGEGDALVLLHGFLESSEIWKPFIPEFSNFGKVICIDLPGHGKSGCIAEVHSMELMAEVVQHVLQLLGVKNADFMGHSMGGYVSLAFLEKYPAQVNKITLLNSISTADSDAKKQIRDRSVTTVQKNKEAFINMSINNLVSPENSVVYEAELEELKSMARSFPVQGITAALKGMKIRKDRTETLKQFSGEKVVIAGEEDALIDIADSEEMAQKCHCRFHRLKGGHLSYLESRSEFENICISSKKS